MQRKRGLNSSCQSIRGRSRSKPTLPSIPWRATGYSRPRFSNGPAVNYLVKKWRRNVKSDRFIQLDGSHVTTEKAKLEEEQLLELVRGRWDTCEPMGRDFAFDPEELTDE